MSIDPIKAAIFAAVLIVLGIFGWRIHAYGEARFEAGQASTQAKWDKEKAKVAEAARRTLVAIRRIDAANAAKSAADSKRFLDERQDIAQDAAYWRDRYLTGRVPVGARFTCPAAGSAGNPGAPDHAGTHGLTQHDAAFLVGFAGERDRIASERNEAVNGWVECRRISAQAPQ